MYVAVTREIKVSVEPCFLDDESAPDEGYFFWAYTVEIENRGEETVQLRSRYWRITDASGKVHEVHGIGVVGVEPVLEPGGSFRYTSGAPLKTPSGFMSGSYQMETGNGEQFNVDIPVFSLDSPHDSRSIN